MALKVTELFAFEHSFTPETDVVAEFEGGATIRRVYTPVWLHRVSEDYRRNYGYKGPDFTLGSIPDAEWDDLAEHYDAIYFLTIFQRGQMGKDHAMIYADQYQGAALTKEDADSQGQYDPQKDIISSGFPHLGYEHLDPLVAPGDWEEFDRVIEAKLHPRGLKVGVDFVGHIVAMDHPLVGVDKDFFVTGTPKEFEKNQKAYMKQVFYDKEGKSYYIAHGNDQHADSWPWTDSAKVRLSDPRVQQMITNEAVKLITEHAIDFLRLDMAHLSTKDNFPKTCPAPLPSRDDENLARQELWDIFPQQVHKTAEEQGRSVALIAEAYDHEDHLLKKGIDFVYGHEQYYKLQQGVSRGEIRPVHQSNHLKFNHRRKKEAHYQETHDGNRAADANGLGSWENSKIQATISAFRKDGPWMVYDGQEYGDINRPPMQLRRVRPMYTADGSYINWLTKFRKTKFFKESEGSTPEHFSDGDDTYLDLIVEQLESKKAGIIACINPTGGITRKCLVRLPKNATNLRVLDLDTKEMVYPIGIPFSKIDDPDHLYLSVVIHGPKQAQLILYNRR